MTLAPETLAAINCAIREVMARLAVPEPLTASQWADRDFYLSPESSSIPGPWVTFPYQVAILDVMGHDDVTTVTWQKSARVGYTKLCLAVLAYNIAHRRRSQVLYQPTDGDSSDFVASEINPMIRDCPPVSEQLLAPPSSKSEFNTNERKQFKGCNLYTRGGKSSRNYRRLTVDTVMYDELDAFDMDIDKAGSATSLGDKRFETSSFKKSIRGSTPREAMTSQIMESMSAADQVFDRHVACQQCGERHPLRWEWFKWDSGKSETVRHECPHCHAMQTYSDFGAMDRGGRWVAESGMWIDEDGTWFRDAAGQVVPPPRHVGFKIWSAYSYFLPWPELIDAHLEATARSKEGDDRKLKTFTNEMRGEPWERQGETVEAHVLMRNREQYAHDVPGWVRHVTAAVDVQNDRLELEVVGWGPGEESAGIRYQQLYGRLDQPEIWDVLDHELSRLLDGDGRQWSIDRVCIDSGGSYTGEVYAFVRRNPERYWAIKGRSQAGYPIVPVKLPEVSPRNWLRLIPIGTDTAKELIYDRYRIVEQGPGYCHYNIDPRANYHHAYFKGATSERQVVKYRRGVRYMVWEKDPNVPNEPLDLRVYNVGALRLSQQFYGVSLEDEPPPEPQPPPEVPDPSVRRAAVRRPGKSWSHDW